MYKRIAFGEYFFHATFKQYYQSIQQYGLITNPNKHNWLYSLNYIYLSNNCPKAWYYSQKLTNPYIDNSKVIMLAIKVKNISFRNTKNDDNLNDGFSIMYNKRISPDDLFLCKFVNNHILIDDKPISEENTLTMFNQEQNPKVLYQMFKNDIPYSKI